MVKEGGKRRVLAPENEHHLRPTIERSSGNHTHHAEARFLRFQLPCRCAKWREQLDDGDKRVRQRLGLLVKRPLLPATFLHHSTYPNTCNPPTLGHRKQG